MADVEKLVKSAVESKKAIIGTDRATRALQNGELSAVVVASNCPEDVKAKLAHYAELAKAELHDFSGASSDLGAICKKPFSVAVVGIKK